MEGESSIAEELRAVAQAIKREWAELRDREVPLREDDQTALRFLERRSGEVPKLTVLVRELGISKWAKMR